MLNYFNAMLEHHGASLSVAEVNEVIKRGAMQFKKDRLKVNNEHTCLAPKNWVKVRLKWAWVGGYIIKLL